MKGRNSKRQTRRRVTGRFYAFLSVLVVIVVFAIVLIAGRGAPQSTNANSPNSPEPPAATGPAPSAPAPEAPSVSGDEGDEGDEPIAEADKVKVQDLSVRQGLPSEWRNILLLGTDTRNLDETARTDTIIIASVNAGSGKVKLTSVMRDLVVPYTTQDGQTKEVKINSLIGRGGAELVMKTVNELFGMNISDYLMVNFASFQQVVDILGGVDMDVSAEEMDEINEDLGKMAQLKGMTQEEYLAQKDDLMLKTYGAQTHLTGIQALGYARIRHVGNSDYRRTERQRDLLDAILRKVKREANLVQMVQMATSMWGEFTTNMDFGGAISLATAVLKGDSMKLDDSARIPGVSTSFVSETRSSLGAALYDCDFEANAQQLYKFIYEG